LRKFLQDALEDLSAEDLQALDELLLLSDNDLLDVLMGRKPVADVSTATLVLRIQNA
jgi:succinate dehydrogenase flavin-adding protein (antitoxin of CptAB toxin-antitoxin module)